MVDQLFWMKEKLGLRSFAAVGKFRSIASKEHFYAKFSVCV